MNAFQFSELLAAARLRYEVPGLVASLRCGSEAYSAASGYAALTRLDQATTRTRFRILGMTKVFTVIGLFRTLTDPERELQAKVVDLVPELNACPGADKISVLQLCNHTSGLPNMPSQELAVLEGVLSLETLQEARLPSVDRLLNALVDVALLTPPGQSHLYSNLGFALLGVWLERHSGSSLAALMRDLIFTPAGMTDSTLQDGELYVPGRALGYFPFDGLLRPVPDYDIAAFSPAGGVFSTAADMNSFMDWQLNMLAIPSDLSRSIAQMAAPSTVLPANSKQAGVGRSMGLGWFSQLRDGERVVDHGGADPGYAAFMRLHIDRKAGVFVAMNSGRDPSLSMTLATELIEAIDCA